MQKKEELINMLLRVYNNNNNNTNNPNKPPISAPQNIPQIRRNLNPLPSEDFKKPLSQKNKAFAVPKDDKIMIEEKLRSIDAKIVNARQKSLLLKNERVHKLKEDYIKRVICFFLN